MGRQWFRQLINCTSKVYHLKQLIKGYADSRRYPRIQTETIGLCLFFGFMFRMKSLEQLEDWIEEGVFKKLIKRGQSTPTVDTMRASLKGADVEAIQQMKDQTVEVARRNKALRGGTIDGWIVSAMDGVELFDSVKKSSRDALTRVIDGVTHYYYRFVGCMTIGREPRIIWGVEPLLASKGDSSDKDEGELTAGKRLVESLYERFHHFTDMLVCDALYANAPFINQVRRFGIHPIIRMKNTRLNIVKDALGLFKKRQPNHVWCVREKNKRIRIEAWEEYELEMTNVCEKVRFVRFVEHIQTLCRGKVVKEETKEVMLVTTCGSEVGLESLWKMIHKRWDIENCLFHVLKTYCQLDHRFVDGINAICACVAFQVLVFNLWQLFLFRYLRNYNQKRYRNAGSLKRWFGSARILNRYSF